jgi:hypothetical protein
MSDTKVDTRIPMTAEVLAKRKGQVVIDNGFLFGDNWICTAAWYQTKFPGFTSDQCRVLELYSQGIRSKQYRSMLKKQTRCSQSSSVVA